MCGRFTLKQPRRINIINFEDTDLPPLPPRYNIAPTQDVLTVVEREKTREARMLLSGISGAPTSA
jgi:putative SOS response-associated peptidase YedK